MIFPKQKHCKSGLQQTKGFLRGTEKKRSLSSYINKKVVVLFGLYIIHI